MYVRLPATILGTLYKIAIGSKDITFLFFFCLGNKVVVITRPRVYNLLSHLNVGYCIFNTQQLYQL